MKKPTFSLVIRNALPGLRAAFVLCLFLLLSFMPANSIAQTAPSDETITTKGAVANAAQQVPPSKSVVRGRVVYDDTNRPVRRTRVMLLEMNTRGREFTGTTNGSGEFQIKDVAAGTFVVMVDAAGVITPISLIEIDNVPENFNRDEIRKYFDEIIVDGIRDITVKVRAKRGGAISGKVTFSDGDPAVNVRIKVMRKTKSHIARIITNVNPSTIFGIQTDDRGIYRIPGLPPGEYIVSATESVQHDVVAGDQDGGVFDMFGKGSMVVTYYKDATKSSDATVVQIDLGQDQNEINISLAARVLHTISGKVIARNGSDPVEGAVVSVKSKDGPGEGSMLTRPTSAATDAEGLFTFLEIPDGVYSFEIKPPYVSGDDEEVSDDDEGEPTTSQPANATAPKRKFAGKTQEVTVSGSDITDLIIGLAAGASVSGIVTTDGASALPQDLSIRLQTPDRESINKDGRVQMDGRFSIDAVPTGAFYFALFPLPNSQYYLKSMAVGGIDLMSDPLVVGEDADVKDVRVVIGSDGATLSGRILSAVNTPAGGVRFALIPTDQRKWRARASYLFGSSSDDGSYSVFGAPGEYLVIFIRDMDVPLAINEAWIRDHATNATRVSLAPNERKNLDLTVPSP